MEQFLACHQHAFAFFGNRIPEKIMVDNLKSAVLKRLTGEAPVFNPRYLDFSNHSGFTIKACNVRKGNEKGRVENGVGYIKKNLLNGLDIPDFSVLNPTAQIWLETIANVRIHGETHKRPVDLFTTEQPCLQIGPGQPYDTGAVLSVRASSRFRVSHETNRYSVPAEYASTALTIVCAFIINTNSSLAMCVATTATGISSTRITPGPCSHNAAMPGNRNYSGVSSPSLPGPRPITRPWHRNDSIHDTMCRKSSL